jgi:3-methyl-2-oxobutanoate hydroxymethyltransferase
VQVVTDFLGLGTFMPRHAKPYADLRGAILAAATAYKAEVEAGTFPGAAQSSRMDDAVLDEVLGNSPDDRTAAGQPGTGAGIPLDRDL